MDQWAEAANLLQTAKEVLEKRPWSANADGFYKMCAATGLERAVHDTSASLTAFMLARASLQSVLCVAADEDGGSGLEVPYWGRSIMDWNDAPGRTKDEVLDAFEKAAQRAYARSPAAR